MSRGFRDADATQQAAGREADDAIQRIHAATEQQSRHAAELRDSGTYGICEACGAPVGKERLEAVPEATRCIRCQAEWEADLKRT
jgi:DnaK suppressor protein